MAPLPADLRRDLERAVVRARETAEAGAANALAVLGVADERAPGALSEVDRKLRIALRAQAHSLGNGQTLDGIDGLREQIAYAVWHRMLFARFLAENGLLVHSSGAPLSIADVAELAREEGEPDPWALAARYAATMLPGIFGTTDPTTRVTLAPDDRLRLEAILTALPADLFGADDALGWVYQFWQSKRKDEVNKRGDKIGGADLAPVTQLFTEHYMVRFLLENSLGAWWAGRHPDSPLLREWEYLRYRDDRTPAAGTFDAWPAHAAEITVMDPCLGSGHFLVAAADMLRKMRIEEEGLSAAEAAAAVLRDNLFGLELDPRCTQLAAFALAFDAWKAAGAYRALPVPNIACSGIAVKGQLEDWRRLAGTDDNLRTALERLYALFQDAPDLGSLIDPRAAAGKGLWAVDPDRLLATLDKALQTETEDPAAAVFGAAAQGTAKAARLLSQKYWLVATNPPFLGRDQQGVLLRRYLEDHHPMARFDLGVAFVPRCLAMLRDEGTVATVSPQNWFFLGSYVQLRRQLLEGRRWRALARLGTGAFVTPMWAFNVGLAVIAASPGGDAIGALDAAESDGPTDKAAALRSLPVATLSADRLSATRHCVIDFREHVTASSPLSMFAEVREGTKPGQTQRVTRSFWEVAVVGGLWRKLSSSPSGITPYSGNAEVIIEPKQLVELVPGSNSSGLKFLGRAGVLMSKMGTLPVAIYPGEMFDNNTFILVPRESVNVAPIWSLATSDFFREDVRARYQKLDLTVSVISDIPFDLEHWTKVASEQYPNGLPVPHSDDPTQWLFKGAVVGSEAPLQVAVARLLGYRWPDQEPDALDAFADPDGIACLPPVGRDAPAAERLEKLLARAYGSAWHPALRAELLAGTGGKARDLETWLRDEFFVQHARLFHNRPFIWHIWDGRRDGFSALLHYHRFTRATLEKLAFNQLGEWLERQRAAQRANEPSAEARVAAAQALQRTLQSILEGEPPVDIYVRWKPLAEQPIGWEPDLDDGVRLNIRPFVTAGILRDKFTINWNKDRGKNPDGSERLNDLHLTLAEKQTARGNGP